MQTNRIAEGDYIFRIVDAYCDADWLAVTFRIVSRPRYILGRSFVYRFACSGEHVDSLCMMLEACGKEVARRKVRLDLDEMIGLECAGTVIDDERGWRISNFFPAADLGYISRGRRIEWYIPARYKRPMKYIPLAQRGKVIEIRARAHASATYRNQLSREGT
jgi:hypothetical protein